MEPKYKNIRFCHPSSNEECSKLLFQYNAINNRNNPYRDINNTYRKIQEYSGVIENTVRNLWGSLEERYLLYDVIYQGSFHLKMREVDLVNIKSSDTIEIGEIKFTSNKKQSIQNGLKQLQISSRILSGEYSNVECTLIIVDLVSGNRKEKISDSIFGNSKVVKKNSGFKLKLIEILADELFDYVMSKNIITIDADELQSVMDEAMENEGRRQQNRVDRKSSKIEKLINEIYPGNNAIDKEPKAIPVFYGLAQTTFYNNKIQIGK